ADNIDANDTYYISNVEPVEVVVSNDPGSSLNTATSIPLNAHATIIHQTVGASFTLSDLADTYKITLGAETPLDVHLSGMNAWGLLQIYNQGGELISSGFTQNSYVAYQSNGTLQAGDYYIMVQRLGLGSEYYNIVIDVFDAAALAGGGLSPVVEDSTDGQNQNNVVTINPVTDPGSNSQDAHTIDSQAARIEISQTLESLVDDLDTYRFTLTENQLVNFSLSGLSADVDIVLLDSNFNVVTIEWEPGSADVTLSRVLDAGTYYVQTSLFSGTRTDYHLVLERSTAPTTPDPDRPTGPGTSDNDDNTIGTATELSFNNNTALVTDNIAGTNQFNLQDASDFYKITLFETSQVDFLLSNLAADVDLLLYNSSGDILQSRWTYGNEDVSSREFWAAGTYYAEVTTYDYAQTNYQLVVTRSDYTPATAPAGYTIINTDALVRHIETNSDIFA
ncbi:MAG: PPC domain-containing protein, partial [Pseudomonadota bacterium]